MLLFIRQLKNQARQQLGTPSIGWKSVKYLFVELFIVFVGVYGAYLLSTYNQAQQQKEDQQRVYVALHNEIRVLGKLFGSIASYHDTFNEGAKQKLANNEAPTELEYFRYISPQYPLDVLESALRVNSFDMLDLPLHIQLSQYHSDIQKLIYTEQKITEISENYVLLHNASPDSWLRQYRWSMLYLEDRRSILKRLAITSEELVSEIDKRITSSAGQAAAVAGQQ